MRDTFVDTLIDIAKNDKDVILVTGDLGFGVLKPFWEQLPDQFINAGIAEQNMTGMAAGMALEGKTVFTYSIGNFPTLRCLEQIRNDCAYHDANVKIVCVGGGFVYGALGMSHHATEDIAVMRAMPGISVFAPSDLLEAKYVTQAIYKTTGTCYLRLGRGGEKRIHEKIEDFRMGKAIKVKDGEEVVICSTGAIFDEIIEANRILLKSGINAGLYTFPTVKPMDCETLSFLSSKYNCIITVEEHNRVGGFGSAVAEVLAQSGTEAKLVCIGTNDVYSSSVGTQKFLRKVYSIDAASIVNVVMANINTGTAQNL
ncbi:transketolase [Desulfosporosinus sp. Tol-M]|nr:transketolase [Desulfosporosinus sp. Tol-M]